MKIVKSTKITRREKTILELICEEYSSQEIANKLGISLNTVNNHRKKILLKTKSKNIVSLVKYGYLHGYLRLESQIA